MTSIDFLLSPIVNLPKTRSTLYRRFMRNILNNYINGINRIVGRGDLVIAIKSQLDRVIPLSSALLDVLDMLIAGDRRTAYARLDAALADLGYYLQMLMPDGNMAEHIDPMFRFRLAEPTPFGRKGLFHIPFDQLDKVRPRRYSVAGQPSIYLGGSTNVCWRELGEPDLSKVTVARFRPAPTALIKILNLGIRLPMLGAWVRDEPMSFLGHDSELTKVAAHVSCWPLVAACSIRVLDRNSPDPHEYLIPQLLLEWVRKTYNFDGIRYFSTHYEKYPDDPKTSMNYVFPTRTAPNSGYCRDLCALFELTEPVSWDQAQAYAVAGMATDRPRYTARGVPDAKLEYEFGRAEDGLLTLPLASLDPAGL